MADAAGDRLSSLPDDILHRVLSLLPSFDEAARTSILARRWRHLWSSNAVLHFSFSVEFLTSAEGHSGEDVALAQRVISVVDECLLRASAPVLVSLQLPVFPTPGFPSVLSRWIRFAANHSAAEIMLHPVLFKRQEIAIPSVIFDCRDLCSLKVDSCTFPSIPSRSIAERRCFTMLKTLFMFSVCITCKSLEALVSLCPNIERLALSSCKLSGGIVISSSTLRFFAVYQSNRNGIRVKIVSAPRLQHLVYSGAMKDLVFKAGVLPELEEATILFTSKHPFKDKGSWRCFASSIAHVKILSVNSWFYQFALHGDRASVMTGEPMFKNLRELHSWPVFQKSQMEFLSGEQFTSTSVLELFSALRDCPLIEKLCVHRNFEDEEEEKEEGQMNWMCMKAMSDLEGWGLSDDDDPYQEVEWVDPLEEFEDVGYALPHLKILKVIEYSGKRLEERLVEFVLDKAVNLRSVVIYYVPDVAEELEKMSKVANAFPKASADARISMLELPDKPCSKDDFMISLRVRSIDF